MTGGQDFSGSGIITQGDQIFEIDYEYTVFHGARGTWADGRIVGPADGIDVGRCSLELADGAKARIVIDAIRNGRATFKIDGPLPG